MSNKKFKIGNAETVAIVVGVLLLVMFAYNGIRLSDVSGSNGLVSLVGASEIMPAGVPAIYGEELGISYDDVNAATPRLADATIGVMSNLDRSLTLEGADLERYIRVLSDISCEYCCGAASVIFDDGRAACGCAHSYAMRGIAKYLITEHADMSDEAILTEVAKWKVLFFPGIHETKAAVMKSQGIDTNYINLASNAYRGIEKGAPQQSSGGMVGGC